MTKMGRPPKNEKTLDSLIRVRIDGHTKEDFIKHCTDNNTDASTMIREFIHNKLGGK